MKKFVIIALVILVVAIGVYFALPFIKPAPARPDTEAAFLAAVQKERRATHESTDINPAIDFWYKSSVIYTLDVEVFKDSDGDGIGDFKGLTRQLDYIQSLGADAIWLQPFQPTPNKDDGYDVSDYYHIDPRLGDSTDFQQFIKEANKRNMRVIMDLNLQNPAVEKEIQKVIEYWLNQGIAGFGLEGEKFGQQFDILTRLRHVIQAKRRDAIILGEANILPKEQEQFFGKNGNAMHMMFNFYVNQHLFYALATGEADGLADALEVTKNIPEQAAWAGFLRNHDELDLGRLTDEQRQKVYAVFGPDSSMQLYQHGIRRRLAPMLHDNINFIEFAYSALFAMPAIPVIRYGDEIGMGDDLQLKERESIRTPMQWSNQRNGGFSTASKTVRPVIDSGQFGYKHVNVNMEKKDSASLLNFVIQMVRLRKSCPEIGWGDWKILDTGSPYVLAILYHWQNRWLITVHNFSTMMQQILINPGTPGHTLQNLLSYNQSIAGSAGTHILSIEGYGYRWYRVEQ